MLNRKDLDNYISTLKEPSIDRTDTKYYTEIQTLAVELIHYLKMNDDKNEHANQGNWNMTYFVENLKKEDLEFLTIQCMKRIPTGRLKSLITERLESEAGYLLTMPHPSDQKSTMIEKRELDRYLYARITSYVAFGFGMGVLLVGGAAYFFT